MVRLEPDRGLGFAPGTGCRGSWLALGGGMMGHGLVDGYGFGYGYGRPFMGGPWLWGIGLFGLLIRLVVWGVLIVLGVALVRRLANRADDDEIQRSDLSPLTILKRRYAAGEITREQYDEMSRVLDAEPDR